MNELEKVLLPEMIKNFMELSPEKQNYIMGFCQGMVTAQENEVKK